MRNFFPAVAATAFLLLSGGCTVSSSTHVTNGDGKTETNFFGAGVDPATGKPWISSEKKIVQPVAVTMRGKPVTLIGESPAVGDAAPQFVGVANDMSDWKFSPAGGKVVILSAVPSLDTGVCSRETHRFNEEIEKLNKEGVAAEVVTISMDLPFAQKRWCGAENVTHVTTVSDFKDREFARAYGLKIKESGLLARAVFVVGKDGKIVYREICSELSSEPDYAKVMEAAKAAAK